MTNCTQFRPCQASARRFDLPKATPRYAAVASGVPVAATTHQAAALTSWPRHRNDHANAADHRQALQPAAQPVNRPPYQSGASAKLAVRSSSWRAAVFDRELQRGRGGAERHLDRAARTAFEGDERSGEQLLRNQHELARHWPGQPLPNRCAGDSEPTHGGEEGALATQALTEFHGPIPGRPPRWRQNRWRRHPCYRVARRCLERSHRRAFPLAVK